MPLGQHGIPIGPVARWVCNYHCLGVHSLAAQACKSPIVAKSGHTRILVENPLKALFCRRPLLWKSGVFLAPGFRSQPPKRFSVSLWRVMAFIGSLEVAALAIIGIVTIDRPLEICIHLDFPPPTVTATISFLLLVIAFTRTDPRPQLISILQRFGTQWMAWNWARPHCAYFSRHQCRDDDQFVLYVLETHQHYFFLP